jgi:hypothetical protein
MRKADDGSDRPGAVDEAVVDFPCTAILRYERRLRVIRERHPLLLAIRTGPNFPFWSFLVGRQPSEATRDPFLELPVEIRSFIFKFLGFIRASARLAQASSSAMLPALVLGPSPVPGLHGVQAKWVELVRLQGGVFDDGEYRRSSKAIRRLLITFLFVEKDYKNGYESDLRKELNDDKPEWRSTNSWAWWKSDFNKYVGAFL